MKTHSRTGMALAASVIMTAALGCAPMQGPLAPEGGAAAQPAASPGGAAGEPAAAAQAVSPAAAESPAPRTAAECAALATKPTAAGQAGSASQPQKQLDDVFQAHHETFRCCVDALGAPTAGRVDETVALVVTLDSAGKLTSSDIVLPETSAQAPDVQACVIDVAKALAYPKPGNDMDVRYKRVFHFKARR